MNLKQLIRLFFVGVAMGVANIIPGVSGGTIAVVFGIYSQLMEALGNFITDKNKRKQHIVFLTVLFSGSLIAVIALAGILSWAYANYPLMTVYFFMGLILGSIPVVVKSHHDMKINITRFLVLVFGITVVVILAMLQGDKTTQAGTISFTEFSFFDYIYFFICGIIASSAMIIPGVSGSFILILLGAYWTVLEALSGLPKMLIEHGLSSEVMIRGYIIGALGIGVVIGILGFSRIMDWALKKFPAETMFIILGLIIGSFYQIYPGFEINLNGAGALITFVIGILISLKFAAKPEK